MRWQWQTFRAAGQPGNAGSAAGCQPGHAKHHRRWIHTDDSRAALGGCSNGIAWATTNVDDGVGAAHRRKVGHEAGATAAGNQHGQRGEKAYRSGKSGMIGVMVDREGAHNHHLAGSCRLEVK
jgi:hypothetical protein